jgi:predicted  nucleic acid-binding Zn-ribbon protein
LFCFDIEEKNQEFQNIEKHSKVQQLLQEKDNQFSKEKEELNNSLSKERQLVQSLQQEIATLTNSVNELKSVAAVTGGNEGGGHSSEEVQALKNEIISLQDQLQNMAASLTDKRFTEADFKGVISEIFSEAMSSFITEDEMNSIEDETLKTHTIALIKTTLKRLKEILKQVSMERLAP